MNSKTWLVIYGLISVLVIGAAAYFCIASSGKYRESMDLWDQTRGMVTGLERKVPYPSDENKEILEGNVEEYEAAVKQLFESVDKFQKPLNTTLQSTQFQQLVKEKVESFRPFADSGGLRLDNPEEFFLGFDAYATNLPPQELVGVLDYELAAVDHLLRKLVVAGASALYTFERDLIPGEAGGPPAHEISVVHKYPVRMQFEIGHSGFQSFINQISNDKDYFYIVRVLKVENEKKEGPVKNNSANVVQGSPQFVHPETREFADSLRLEEWGYPEVTGEALEARAREDGFQLATVDARVLMGQEKLNVFMVVDISRFLDPETMAPEAKPTRSSKGKK